MNQDTLESAIIDGASRWQRLRYVVIPHLAPLITFIALIHLMDCYRVFEEIIGFSSQSHVISLQWLTYDFLTPDDAGNRAISRASASAMLTMIGIVIPASSFHAMRWSLNLCGVNAASLFPDLDGLTRRITQDNTYSADEVEYVEDR